VLREAPVQALQINNRELDGALPDHEGSTSLSLTNPFVSTCTLTSSILASSRFNFLRPLESCGAFPKPVEVLFCHIIRRTWRLVRQGVECLPLEV